MKTSAKAVKFLCTSLLLLALGACGTVQKAQYGALEKVGIHKRDILIDRIEKTTATQEATRQQIQSAYEQLAALISVDDRGLEKKYKQMAASVEASENRSEQLEQRIASVDQVARDLFAEWQQELEQYTNPKLRATSERNMQTTRDRYQLIHQKMRSAHQSIAPVLNVLQDNTLYLKHNLNARAVSSLSGEVVQIQGKVATLVEQMEASIAESQKFLESMQR